MLVRCEIYGYPKQTNHVMAVRWEHGYLVKKYDATVAKRLQAVIR